ncbi:phosphonate C-P lyase system protein PhnH [Pelagovum pacificum]|uniref:Phosphonate C-P lyase system protein PhnH n=1 Tax=Pelagovum pacificum TaxID=2588711 RepID=A0A5C5GHU1_9RHOB|nr:phosphonate C-P lyase system protein PhnH [Pelagovum pacificum]QQA43852.1 phosphonate C-P lyase system protein PhnH [Pelagovum pacificum]TNY33016.1 phosphonate C-P lyase system protein PhnH [Pelagovum pacificum]
MARAPGFADPARDSARAFRIIMQAMARPGEIHSLPGHAPEGLSVAAAQVLLTLADPTTPVSFRGDAVTARDWLLFHTGAPEADAAEATFAVGAWPDLLPVADYPVGTPDYPDRSATLVVEVDHLSPDGPVLVGPGIRDTVRLRLPDTDVLARNAALYPQGLDLILTCGDRLAAVPRSTRLKEAD